MSQASQHTTEFKIRKVHAYRQLPLESMKQYYQTCDMIAGHCSDIEILLIMSAMSL